MVMRTGYSSSCKSGFLVALEYATAKPIEMNASQTIHPPVRHATSNSREQCHYQILSPTIPYARFVDHTSLLPLKRCASLLFVCRHRMSVWTPPVGLTTMMMQRYAASEQDFMRDPGQAGVFSRVKEDELWEQRKLDSALLRQRQDSQSKNHSGQERQTARHAR